MGFGKFIEEKGLTESLEIGTQDYGYISEASFSAGKLKKVSELYGKILGKQLGGEFKVLGVEDYKGQFGAGKGYRSMNNAGAQLRFNYDEQLSKYSKLALTSISYWAPDNKNFQQPSLVMLLHPSLNVIEILNSVGKSFRARKLVENDGTEVEAFVMNEARSTKELKAWLAAKNLPDYLAGEYYQTSGKLAQRAAKDGLTDQLEMFMGAPEKNSFEAELKVADKALDKQIYADPDTVFEDIESLLSLVASGKWRTLIICGMGGIGKTYHVTEGPKSLPKILGPEGQKWTYHSGTKAAPFAFYKTLFQERDKVIVFDEADGLLKNSEIIMMLKPILDTSGNNMAEYITGTSNMVGKSAKDIKDFSSYVDAELADGAEITMGREKKGLTKLPSKFEFEGGMVFISNMKASEIEGAIMSRSIFVDVHLAAQDVEKRIKTIGRAMAKNDPDVTDADVDEVMEALGGTSPQTGQAIEYMTPAYARKSKQLTIRALSLALTMKKAKLKDWDRLAAIYA